MSERAGREPGSLDTAAETDIHSLSQLADEFTAAGAP
jgi:hypothetical protein